MHFFTWIFLVGFSLMHLWASRPATAQAFSRVGAGFEELEFDALLGPVVLGDLDNDGDLDAILVFRGSRTVIYRNGLSEEGALRFTPLDDVLPFAGSLDLGDYDNDGDLDLLLTRNSATFEQLANEALIYRNEGGAQFTPITLDIPGVVPGSDRLEIFNLRYAAWGDYDNDGDLDIALTGHTGLSVVTDIFRNDGDEVFTPIQAGLPEAANGTVAWGDMDADGDLDLLLGSFDADEGETPRFIQVIRNDGNNQFVPAGSPLPGVGIGSVSWADADQDGDLDVLTMGSNDEVPMAAIHLLENGVPERLISTLPTGAYADWIDYDNDGDLDLYVGGRGVAGNKLSLVTNNGGSYAEADSLTGTWLGSIASGDLDRDGDLDLIVAGNTFRGGTEPIEVFVHLNQVTAGEPPSVPDTLEAAWEAPGVLTFSWKPATDDTTPASALTYNVRVGTAPGRGDVLSAMAHPDGTLLKPHSGNAGARTSLTLRNLPEGSYYWTVQTIDASLTPSAFAPEQEAGSVSTPTEEALPPGAFALHRNYPNPFTGQTTLRYELPHPAHVRLAVYDVLGNEVSVLVDRMQAAGRHTAAWNARDARGRLLASGLYLYRLESAGFTRTGSMVLVR